MENQAWWLIFAMAAGIGFFASLLLLTRSEQPRHGTKALAVLLAIFSLTLVFYVQVWSGTVSQFPHLQGLWMASNYIYGPLLLYFFLPEEKLESRWHWLHFLPAAILLVAWLPFGVLPAAEKLEWLQNKSPFDSHLVPNRNLLWLIHPRFMVGAQVIYALFFIIWSWREKGEGKRFRRLVALLFLGFVAANASYFILSRTPTFTVTWDYLISLAMTLCIFRLGTLAFHRPGLFFFLKKQKTNSGKYATSSLKNGQSGRLAERIQKEVESKKIYLDPDLRLPILAEQMKASPHQVSQAVNEQFGCSFSEWVNQYRIAHACRLLSESDGITTKEAGYQSGFNSLSTFYKAFKNTKGMTPKAFRDVTVEG